MTNKKDCIFQYILEEKVFFEDTKLITRDQAYKLVDKWLPHLKNHWDNFNKPKMCIWIDCEDISSYNTIEFEIDYSDCIFKNGNFYKIEKTKII